MKPESCRTQWLFWLSAGLTLAVIAAMPTVVRAEDLTQPVVSTPEVTPTADTPAIPKLQARSKKGKRTREKEAEGTEGTEAPNRFKTDTVIKSQYQLNGQGLEVDPD